MQPLQQMSSPSVALCAESEVQSPSGDVSGIEIFRFSRLLLSEHNVCDSKGLKMLYVFIIQALNTLKRKSVLVFYSCDCRKMGQALSGENVSSNLPWWTRQSQRETDWELWCCISIHLFVNEDGTDRFQSAMSLPWKWRLRGGMVLRDETLLES